MKCGRAAVVSDIEVIDFLAFGRPTGNVVESADVSRVCDLLTRFVGGFSDVPAVVGDGLGGDRWESRDRGICTPRLCRLSETRRVE